MMSGTTRAIAAATVVCGIAIFINLGIIISLFVEIGEFHNDAHSEMQEFNAVADQTWTTIIIAAPVAAAAAREKRGAKRSSGTTTTTTSSCSSCSSQPNKCPRGPIGPRGRPGGRGHDGPNGVPGPDAHRITGIVLMSTGKPLCIKCAPGPAGLKGRDGSPGERGVDGAAGRPGVAGRNGQAGTRGALGDAGVRGSDGEAGPRGYPGRSGVAGKGAPGEPGRMGGRGNWGKQGRRGAIGAPGTPGPMGPKGDAGSNGESGLDGLNGAAGLVGVPGKNGEYCKCPKKDEAVAINKVVKNDRGYEVPQEVAEIQKLVESASIKMEAPEAPPATSTAGYTDDVEAASTTEGPSPPSIAPAATSPAEPAAPAVAYGEPIETVVTESKEPTRAPSSSESVEGAAPIEEVTEAASSTSTVGYEQPVEVTTSVAVETESSPSTTAPPGFAPPRANETESSSAATAEQAYDAAPTVPTTVNDQAVVQVTQLYHRATGGGRITPTTTTRRPVPLVKFARHAGGWSRRANTPLAPKPVPKVHDADLHLARKSFGGARAV